MHGSTTWKLVVTLSTLLGVGVPIARADAASSDTTPVWIPSIAPVPESLPTHQPIAASWLSSVSCPSPTFCVAVGAVTYGQSGASYPLIETYANGTWTTSFPPKPPNTMPDSDFSFGSVSCSAVGSCAAVGIYDKRMSPQTEAQDPLLATLTNGKWTTTGGSLPKGDLATNGLSDLSCVVGGALCMAVGWADAGNEPLAYMLHNGHWQRETSLPMPQSGGQILPWGVSCPGAKDCLAYGQEVLPHSSTYFGITLTWSSGSWSLESAPAPNWDSPFPFEDPYSVACTDVTDCVFGDETGLFVLSDGKYAPSAIAIPPLVDNQGVIFGLSCQAGIGSCVADGFYTVNNMQTGTLITQSSTGWSVISAPLPSGASTQPSGLSGLSCAKVGFCVAVGQYGGDLFDPGNSGTALIERLG